MVRRLRNATAWYALGGASVAMLALRIAWVFRFREIDSDAYGHFLIAAATMRDPTNFAVHWVWLPLFHFVVGGLILLGLTFRGLRLANAVLAVAGPILLYAALDRRRLRAPGDEPLPFGEDAALVGALAFALAPLTTILGQSAQPETLFSVLAVAAFLEAGGDRPRPIRAALALGAACLVRYEAWGAALALALGWAVTASVRLSRGGPRTKAWWTPPSPVLALGPAIFVALYVLVRYWTDGELLQFVRGTREITATQVGREAWSLREIVSFPVVLPYYVLGPALVLVPFGLKPAFGKGAFGTRAGWIMPAGFAAFLLSSYYAGGSHAGERYLVALVPFGCAAIGAGAVRVGRFVRRPLLVAVVTLAVLATTTAWHLRRAATMAIAWDAGLRDREAELMRLAVGDRFSGIREP